MRLPLASHIYDFLKNIMWGFILKYKALIINLRLILKYSKEEFLFLFLFLSVGWMFSINLNQVSKFNNESEIDL